MQIIDKNKDYYDYLSSIYGIDKTITFDRRGSIILSQEDLRNFIIETPFHNTWRRPINRYFVLEVGFVQYLFVVENIHIIEKIKKEFGFNLKYDGDWKLVHIFNEQKHFSKSDISLMKCKNINSIYNFKKHMYIDVITTFSETCEIDTNTILQLPIIEKTILTKYIPQFDIWKELSTFISAKNNDKKIESNMSDVDKAVNHGFDKKTSFRNPIKL